MKKLICIFIIISLIPSICVLTNAEENVEILFSETFEGDLSRWSCDGNEAREKISINKSEDEYIKHTYLYLPVKQQLMNHKLIYMYLFLQVLVLLVLL